MKIQINDDSSFMRTMVKQIILKHITDATFVEASDGIDAIEVYKKEYPQLVTMDLTMPNMNGVEAVKAIKEIDDECKIIMVSAMGQKDLILEAIRAGAKDFIVKPIDEERLMEAIRKNL